MLSGRTGGAGSGRCVSTVARFRVCSSTLEVELVAVTAAHWWWSRTRWSIGGGVGRGRGGASLVAEMFLRRGVYRLPPYVPGDSVWRPAGNPVVLTSVNMSCKLQIPQPQPHLSLVLEDQMSAGNDRLAEAGSPTDAVPHQLGFLPMSGRLLKSESEDSGVELASGDHVPLTPVESEKSFSLDCPDGDDSAPALQEGRPKERPEAPLPVLDCACQDFHFKRKLGSVVQRSKKNPLSVPKKPPPDLEELKSCHHPCQPVRVEGILNETSGGYNQATSGGSFIEEEKTKEEAQQPASGPMPGPGLHSLENLSKMLEKIAKLQIANKEIQHEQQVLECRVQALEWRICTLGQEKAQQPAYRTLPGPGLCSLENLSKIMEKIAKLQKANLEIQHKCQILECQVRILEEEKNERSLLGRLKRRFRIRRGSVRPQEIIQITVTSNTRSDTTSQSRHR